MEPALSAETLERRIYLIRGQRVMLDSHLAELYGVLTKNLNKAVNRNLDRFPDDFAFQLSRSEYLSVRFQFGTLKQGRHSKYLPRVFTEQGVAMLSSVLRSNRAVRVNVEVMRAFVKLRRIAADVYRIAGSGHHNMGISHVEQSYMRIILKPDDSPVEKTTILMQFFNRISLHIPKM